MKTVRHPVTVMAVLLVLFCVGLFIVAAATVEESLRYTPAFTVAFAAPPQVSAKALLIMDMETGTVVYEKRADEVLPIASITKIFSSALFWSGTDPLGTTTIIARDISADGRSGRLKAGQTYQNRELLFPALLESSNDAAAVMQRTAPFDLVAAMNDFAEAHNAVDTTFVDASGLGDGNASTARDLGVLFTAILEEHPHIIDITTLPQYLNHVNAWLNNNPFIEEPGYAGGKHGFTEAANRTAVARFFEPIGSQERPILYILLGSDDLKADMHILREFVSVSASFE